MAGIKAPLQDVLARLATIQVQNLDGKTVNAYTRVWNNQLNAVRQGEQYDFPKPAFFVEILNNVEFNQIGTGFRSADLGFNVHIIHEQLDAGSGTFEQDLAVFDLRDKVVAKLCNWRPTACGIMVSTGEQQDYDHDNLYHYIVSFVCDFTDSKGSEHDSEAGKYVDSETPTGLGLTVHYADTPIVDTKKYQPKF